MDKTRIWFSNRYEQIISSIAFLPGIISLGFLVLAVIVLQFDFSETGQQLKSDLKWLTLKDSSTARSILGAIASGVISLTVFSFTMVMIVLNQAASQMSNRVLDKLIGNRFQQIVLGIYIGTLVYTFFLFSTIRDTESRFQIPSISIFTIILFTVFDLFLFIYFLHFVTQSVKYNVIIDRIKTATFRGMRDFCTENKETAPTQDFAGIGMIRAERSGIFEGFDTKEIMAACEENQCSFVALHPMGTFILQGQPILKSSRAVPDEQIKDVLRGVVFSEQELINHNYEYGMRQLSEIALKALSPGINDPGTAILSFRALMDLLQYRGRYFPKSSLKNEDSPFLVIRQEYTFDSLFERNIYPIWDYGKEDRMIRYEFKLLLEQLSVTVASPPLFRLLKLVDEKINEE